MQLVSAPLRQRASSVHQQQAVDHVAEEVGLLGLGTFGHRNMGKHFLLQNFLGIAQTSFAVETSCCSAVADVVQCNLDSFS